jgi:hypothetical protein
MALPPLLRTRRYAQREISARTGAGGVGLTPVFDDQFTTDDAAAISSPRTCEPGPGTITVTGSDQAIASRLVTCPSNVANQGFLSGSAYALSAGRAMVVKNFQLTGAPSATGLAWGFVGTSALSLTMRAGFYLNNTGLYCNSDNQAGGLVAAQPTASVDYDYAVVERATGHFLLYKLSSASQWTLLHVNDTSTTTPLYPSMRYTSCPLQFGRWRVFDSWSIPRSYYSASGTIGVVSSGSADFVAKMRCTGTDAQSLIFRRQDADNYWYAERAATTFRLFEVVATVATQRASAAITAETAERIEIMAEGSTIRLLRYRSNGSTVVVPTAYASATNFQTATGMAVLDEANYTELEVFPRFVSGVAA